MFAEISAVSAELATKDELMMLNADDRLMSRPPNDAARRRSRFQVVENVEQSGARLERFGIGLIGALRVDHRGQFRRQIDGGAFERRGLDRAETGLPRRADFHLTGG